MLIRNKRDQLVNLAGVVVLMPGINDVEDSVWSEAEKHGSVQNLFTAGILEKVSGANGEAVNKIGGAPAESSINAMDQGAALKLVAETFDRNLLTKWRGEAQSPELQSALDAQLEATSLTHEERETKKHHRGLHHR